MNANKVKELLKKENIFCHVSTTIKFDGKFIPRIPDCRCEKENKDIDRICVSKTLEGAFTAIPSGGARLDYYLMQEYIFKVFLIDIEKLGIDKEDILTSEYLYKNGLVPDANISQEYWITKPFTVPEEDAFIIKITDWHEEDAALVPYEVMSLADKECDGDYYEAYERLYGHCDVPFTTELVDIEFVTENLEEGESISISEEYIPEYQKDIIKNNTSLEVEENSCDIEITALEDTSIKDILTCVYNDAIGYFE